MTTFKFIGDYPEAKNIKSFTVQVTKEEFKRISTFPYPSKMVAEVVSSSNSFAHIGKTVQFVNPYNEMHYRGFPSFVRVYRD